MLLYVFIYIFLLYANAFEDIIPGFNYWDEVITLIVFIYALYKKRLKFKRKNIHQWLWLIALLIVGLMGNLLHGGLQSSNIIVLKDVFAISKFFIICFSLEGIEIDKCKKEGLLKVLGCVSRVIIVITFAIAVIGYVVDIGVYTGEIRLVKCFEFIFSHPTFFVSSYAIVASVMVAESSKKNRVYLILDSIMLFMAQRTKGYVVILAIFVILVVGENHILAFLNKALKTRKITISKFKAGGLLFVAIITVYIIGRSKIIEYISYGMYAARPALYVIGLKLLVDFFPFGSGFGTFASSLSTEVYSKVYSMYGIQNVLGLVKGNAAFAADVFWPCIYGQLGILGLCIYLKMLWHIFKNEILGKIFSKVELALMVLWLYVLIASTVEAYFTNSSGVQFAVISMAFLGRQMNGRKDSK